MAELGIDITFLQRYVRLQPPVRRAVDAAIMKFAEHTHAGLHLEKLAGARDPNVRTIRINNFYRGIVLALGGSKYLLYDVQPHDDANAFAVSRKFGVNQAVGVLEVRDQAGIDELDESLPATTDGAILGGVSTKDLVRLGLDEKLARLLRRISAEDDLDRIIELLPPTQAQVVTGLGAGMTVEEVWAELADRIVSGVDGDDLEAAARRTPDRIAFVDGPVELAEILKRPFDAWRVFLHPTQRHLAYREAFNGPALVTGSAGTGKTVTGLHRAVFLARRLPDDGSKVLLTTFTRALAEALDKQLYRLTDDAVVRSRIDVVSIDKLAYEIVAGARKVTVADDDALSGLWTAAAQEGPTLVTRTGQVTRRSGAFLRREWEQVILAHQLTSAEDYRAAARRGRGDGLRAAQRDEVWAAIQTVVDQLAKRRMRTHLQIADDAAQIAAGLPARYRHIVVDEGQDLHPAQWRLLRALVRPGPNDLFVLADPYQRIYDSQVSLAKLGIEVRGRTHRLTVNYRTTHEILQVSVRVLAGETVVGLDDEADTLRGYHSETHGADPEVVGHDDRDSELDALVDRVGEWLDHDVEPHAIGVAARTGQLVTMITKALTGAGIDVADDRRGVNGVRVATMHRMKGLEFQCLAVVGLDATVLPAPAALTPAAEDPHAHQEDLQRERCLLFVALTRARDVLYLSHAGSPSTLLPAATR